MEDGGLAASAYSCNAPFDHSCSYQKEMYGLFDKYQCSPARSFMGPLANIAVFVPIFFGLRRMGEVGIPGAPRHACPDWEGPWG